MESKSRTPISRSIVPTRNGEIQIMTFEDDRGQPYLLIKRIRRTKSGRIKSSENVPVFAPELAGFYNKLLEVAPQLGLKAF